MKIFMLETLRQTKKAPCTDKGLMRRIICCTSCLLLILANPITPAKAETITIGKGTGVVWEGLPFSGTLSGTITGTQLFVSSIVGIGTSSTTSCSLSGNRIATVGGYRGIQLTPGVILIPQVTVDGYFFRLNGDRANFTGTIGLPSNDMRMADTGKQMYLNIDSWIWCFNPQGTEVSEVYYFLANSDRETHFTGNWVILADGSQASTDSITIPPLYFTTSPAVVQSYQIMPSGNTLRISNLACTANTTTNIDFGKVPRNTTASALLATQTAPLTVSCDQGAIIGITANINLQFRANSLLHESNTRKLSLNPQGGYITGEIQDITGSGICEVPMGIPFDSTPIKLGDIATDEPTQTFNHQIIWRLCSGGSSLPIGRVTASAELLVTYN